MDVLDHTRAPGHYFHNLGLWDEDATNAEGWQLATLATIIKKLGHEEVCIKLHMQMSFLMYSMSQYPVYRE